jgi:hypothetical protein
VSCQRCLSFSVRVWALVLGVLVLAVALLLSGFVLVSWASADLPSTTASWWHLESSVTPTNLPPGGEGQIIVMATNLGDKVVSGATSMVTVEDKLPEGLKTSVSAITGQVIHAHGSGSTGAVTCTVVPLGCTFSGTLEPYGSLRIKITMKTVALDAPSGEENEITVTGGGAPSASLSRPVTVDGAATRFGVEDYELMPENEDGSLDTQAGSHPFQLTTAISLNRTAEQGKAGGKNEFVPQEAGLVKDLDFKWPAGLIGNPTVFPRCTARQFADIETGAGDACPSDTAVGVALVTFNEPFILGVEIERVPVFNLEPEVGEPARFGFEVDGGLVLIDTSIRTGGDYGVTVSVDDITQLVGFLSSVVTVWGVPGDPRHDEDRGWACLGFIAKEPCVALGQSKPPPFLSLPTSCPTNSLTGGSESLRTVVEGDSWGEPRPVGQRLLFPGEAMPALNGCNRLPFSPEIEVSPDGQQASKPTGLTVDVHVPQEGQLNPTGSADSNIKDIMVTLPEGVTLNPAGADGLQACPESDIGYLPGESDPPSELHFTPGLSSCPGASKIATVKIKTPLLPDPLEGAVYLASPQNFRVFPQENPFESLIAMYLVAEDPVSGSLVKLPGRVSLNESTGQIVSTFEDTPQLAFEDAELHFFGGERAPLATPARCGTYTTQAVFTPWSGNPPVRSQSSFQITTGPNGSACPGTSLPFAPSLAVGTTNNQAGSFSALTTTLGREDGQQDIQSVQLHMPAGLSGLLSGVVLCGEAQADAGSCGPESLIGETIVSVGLGGDPFTVTGGKVYITGPYEGAPFGLSIVNPAKAGPFNLQEGRPVVVRAKIEVDPTTAALTITTDAQGGYAIPHILDGIPLEIKHVNVTINRPGFTFNPTNCDPMAVTGTIMSDGGQAAGLSVPFEVANCAGLGFAPKFQVSTQGKTSKANGASLTARLSYPTAQFGSQANISSVKVDLPKQLPSRLTTLQKACTDAQFEADPAGCPAASFIGHASVTTPLLPVPLTGPAIFVSHGGEAFPSLIMVLQGYGVTVDLVGTTFISKAGVTSTTFKTVPDTPFNTFELTLPEGPFSALAANVPAKANYSLCGQKLVMPTAFLAQNGAELHQNTNLTITGCPKTKKATLSRAQKLQKALKVCRKDKNKGRRVKCERKARKRYGPVKKSKKKGKG